MAWAPTKMRKGDTQEIHKTGLLISLQNGNPDAAIIAGSIARIFPKLSPEQVEILKNELGEEVVQKLKESNSS
jgi:hypothetical protein